MTSKVAASHGVTLKMVLLNKAASVTQAFGNGSAARNVKVRPPLCHPTSHLLYAQLKNQTASRTPASINTSKVASVSPYRVFFVERFVIIILLCAKLFSHFLSSLNYGVTPESTLI